MLLLTRRRAATFNVYYSSHFLHLKSNPITNILKAVSAIRKKRIQLSSSQSVENQKNRLKTKHHANLTASSRHFTIMQHVAQLHCMASNLSKEKINSLLLLDTQSP